MSIEEKKTQENAVPTPKGDGVVDNGNEQNNSAGAIGAIHDVTNNSDRGEGAAKEVEGVSGEGGNGAEGPSMQVRDGRGGAGRQGRGRRQSTFNRSKRRGRERPKSEFDSRVLSARRVSRVVAGGRRFSLSVAVAVGNGKGKVGIGTGKGPDMAAAMEKARNQAQKRLVEIQTTKEKGIPSESIGKYCASVVQIRPSKGFVAGGAVRTIAELAGIQHINAKIQSRSKSHLNNARAAMRAFEAMCNK